MEAVEFGSIFEFIRNGANLRHDPALGGTPVSRIETISTGQVGPQRVGYAGVSAERYAQHVLAPGDILFSHINSPVHVGKSALYIGEPPVLIHGVNLLRLRCKPGIDPGFVKHLIDSPGFRASLQPYVNRAVNQASISVRNLSVIKVALPPLDEQRRIARILDLAGVLVRRRSDSIGRTVALRSAVFAERVSAARCRATPLRDLVREFRYGTSSKSGPTGLPVLRIPNVVSEDLDLSELKTVELSPTEVDRLRLVDGDLLFVRSNGNPAFVGRCGLFTRDAVESSGFDPDEFVYASYLIRARPDSAATSSAFLREFLRAPAGSRQLSAAARTSAGQFNLNIVGLGTVSNSMTSRPVRDQERGPTSCRPMTQEASN